MWVGERIGTTSPDRFKVCLEFVFSFFITDFMELYTQGF